MLVQRGSSPGQQEINVVFTDALNMADNHILIKNAAKEIAFKHNRAVSFIQNTNKISAEVPAIFIILYSIKKQKNIFSDTKDNMECLKFLKVM